MREWVDREIYKRFLISVWRSMDREWDYSSLDRSPSSMQPYRREIGFWNYITDRKQPARAVCYSVSRTMIGSTHPSVSLTLARRKRELTSCHTSSEQEKLEEEQDDMEGHSAKGRTVGAKRRKGKGRETPLQ